MSTSLSQACTRASPMQNNSNEAVNWMMPWDWSQYPACLHEGGLNTRCNLRRMGPDSMTGYGDLGYRALEARRSRPLDAAGNPLPPSLMTPEQRQQLIFSSPRINSSRIFVPGQTYDPQVSCRGSQWHELQSCSDWIATDSCINLTSLSSARRIRDHVRLE